MRMFHGAGEGDDLQFSIPALLGILSIPSAFGSIQLLGKYSTLVQWFSGIRLDVYRMSISDEYFFIVYSMVVTGAVVILKWDRLFPDRQDYDNLAVLPISGFQNFASSLFALLFLTSLFTVIVNGAASVIFPYAVTVGYNSLPVLAEFFIAHLAAVVLASFFTCFALLVLMGITLLITPKRYVRTVSIAVRIACALGLIAMAGTAFSALPAYAIDIPAVWFLDLHQTLLVKGMPIAGMGIFAIEITAATFALAMIVYALTYYREYMRIPEKSGLIQSGGRDSYSLVRRILDRWVLGSSFQRATYFFSMKTILRHEKHCMLFGMATAVGFFLAAQTAAQALATPIRHGIDPSLLSVSLTVAFFTIVSLRALFDVPSDRGASWVFRSTVDRHRHEAREVAGKVLVSPVILWLVCCLPAHVMLWGWPIALLHSAYVLMCSIGLAQLLLLKFQKIPFTCTYTASKDKILVNIILGLLGFSLFSGANSRIEALLLERPVLFALTIPCFIALLWGVRAYRRELSYQQRALVFEDRPLPIVQLLNITR